MNETQQVGQRKEPSDAGYLVLYTLLVLPFTLAVLWGAGEMKQAAAWEGLCELLSWVDVVLPALFCCIGWLWIQRRRLKYSCTVYICLVLPMLSAAALPVIYLHVNGIYEGGETFVGMALLAALNLAASLALMGITWLVRLVYAVGLKDAEKC